MKITAKMLKKRFPKEWKAVEKQVIRDIRNESFPSDRLEPNLREGMAPIEAITFNVAFYACKLLYKHEEEL